MPSVGFAAVMGRPSYAFARRPRWLVAHVLVLVLVVVFVNLGLWQLRRLDERRDRNELVQARSTSTPVPVGDLPDDPDDVRFRAVVASGTYGPDQTVAVRTTQDGVPGAWVFSVLDDADAPVVVLRGFVGTQLDGSVPAPPPPEGEVEVEGIAIPMGRLGHTAETAVDRLVETVPGAAPVVVQAEVSSPTEIADLTPVPVPDLGEGPHLNYAVQWFLFAAVGVLAYPFLLRRQARESADDGDAR